MRRLGLLVAFTLAIGSFGSPPLSATERAATYDWFAGAGPVCGISKDACPDVARDVQSGDTVEVSADGALTNHPKSAFGGGRFVHRTASGGLVARGSFKVIDLISFEDWGASPDPAFPPDFRAGRAHFAVHLVATSGPLKGAEADGVLEVTCVLPGAPGIPAGAEEGVTLDLPGIISFEHEVSGLTIFIIQ
jgi:hypothetical protein